MASQKRKPVIGNVDAAIAQRRKKVGGSVRVRATRRGYYGISGKVADLREAGDEFQFATKDLVKVTDEAAFADATYLDGSPKRSVEVDGVLCALPSWVVDANEPIDEEIDEGEETGAEPGSDTDVI